MRWLDLNRAERGEAVGRGAIGYAVRGDAKQSSQTSLLVCTVGVLLRILEEDPSLSARSRDDPHDDESGKTPRAAFHARMRASLAARDPAEALRVFDELSDVYPDDQGAPAYDALMHMAALAGDPDAALDAFEASLALRYEPSSYQHGQIILAHARAGDPERGAEWLAELIETNGPEWSRTSKSASKLFERVLLGAAHAGDVRLFDAQFAKMRAAGAVPALTRSTPW